MTKEELYSYLEHPETLSSDTLPHLERLVEAYPYAGGVVFLYLYNLSLLKDIRYPVELRRLAPRLPDRKLLYGLVEYNFPYLAVTPTREREDDAFSLIERFLDEKLPEAEASLSATENVSVAEDYFGLTLPNGTPSQEETPTDATRPELSGIPSIERTQLSLSPQNEAEGFASDGEARGSREELLLEDTEGDWCDTLFTETLARIYAKQKRYDKALAVFKAIAAKNSGKSAYFADQIRFLQLLIDNNEKEQ